MLTFGWLRKWGQWNAQKVNDISYLNHLIQKNPNIANKDWLLEITNDYLEKNKKLKIAR